MTSPNNIMRYPPPVDLNRYTTFPLRIEGADDHPRTESPDDWRPAIADLVVEDDELYHLPTAVWFRFHNSGLPGRHHVMRDDKDRLYVIADNRQSYELSIISRHGGHRSVSGHYHNPYDAFWTAEQQVNLTEAETPG